MHFVIKCPPSYGRANRRYAVKHTLSANYRIYKGACAEVVAGHKAPFGPLCVIAEFYWHRPHVGDVDAALKATLDGFTEGGYWEDDSRVVCAPPLQRSVATKQEQCVKVWVYQAHTWSIIRGRLKACLEDAVSDWQERTT